MGAEYHHGRGRRIDVPAGRTLKFFARARAAVARTALFAAVTSAAAPAFAQTATPAAPAPAGLTVNVPSVGSSKIDPRFLALLASHPCGLPTHPPEDGDQASPGPTDQPSPAATDNGAATPTPVPSATATDSPSPSPTPSASPTPIPIPKVLPGGAIETIIPPTSQPYGSPTPSPNPLPTTVPASTATGPVFIQRSSAAPTIAPKGASASPGAGNPSPSAVPSPLRTLGPNDVVTVADHLSGALDEHQPSDLTGNVHVFYAEGQVVGDKAHFDGNHTIVLSGHTYLVNRNQDSILYADQIAFDTTTRRATLLNGSGESNQGVSTGKLHYTAQKLLSRTNGVSHGDHAAFTTCENGHAGYHVEAREIDVTPGDKLIARKAVVFLGPTAIFYLPLLVIPLIEAVDRRREATFLPLIGYDQTEGFWIKARIGFGTSNQYYGYYRVEYFTKIGLGLGYVAYIGAKDAHRYTTIDSYTIDDRQSEDRKTNVTINDVETFSQHLRASFGVQYAGDFGPDIDLPASTNITGSIVHQGPRTNENLTFSRYIQGSQSDNLDLGFAETITLSPNAQEQLNFGYAKFNSPLASNDTFHIQSDTHFISRIADYTIVYDKTDYSSNPFGYDRLPEIQIAPHLQGIKFAPTIAITMGEYAEQQNHFSTQRFQGQLNEAYFAKLGASDFSANYSITQDYYGTGDEKAFDQQNASLSTPLGNHIVNSITYSEQHPIGPANVPFQLLDNLGGGSHSAQDVFRFYNKDVYSLTLSDGTNFDRMAQGVTYQLSVRPSPRSYFVASGYYQPGSGNGFATTNVQAITPFGKDTTLELSTNVDWKNHMRLEDKNLYLSRTVDQCYNILASYNQDLKQFSLNIVILAFPGASAGFGFGGGQQSSPIIPQNFVFGGS